jgi:hypothetical protein
MLQAVGEYFKGQGGILLADSVLSTVCAASSSLGATTLFFECFGLLNI